MAIVTKPFIHFGNSKVVILAHGTYKQGFINHRATIWIMEGSIEDVYLKNEVLDLISKHVGYDPIKTGIYGSRTVIKKEGVKNQYGLYWSTGTGVLS